MEVNKKDSFFADCFLAILVMVFGFLLRWFMYLTYKYPVDLDTYYYLKVARDKIVGYDLVPLLGNWLGDKYIIYAFMVLSILAILVFYILARQYMTKGYAFISSFFFALSPLVFFNTKFTLIDKNIPSLIMIMLIIIIMSSNKIKEWTKAILMIPVFIMFAFVWDGWPYMFLLVLLYYVLRNKVNIWIKLIFGVYVTIGLIYGFYKYAYILLNPIDRVLISELNPIWNIGIFAEYLIMALVFVFVFTKIRLEKHDKDKIYKYLFLYVGFIVSFFAMCVMFRMNIFLLPFLYIWFGIMLQEFEYASWVKLIVLIIIAIFVFGTSWRIYYQQPVMNDAIKESMDYVNTLPSNCLVGVWSLGHVYQYYTNKTVLFSAKAEYYLDQIDYLVKGNSTVCTLMWSDDDIKALQYMIEHKTKENITVDQYYISKTPPDKIYKYNNMSYYILNRGG